MSKKAAFEVLVEWQALVDKETSDYTQSEHVHEIVGNWHVTMRMHGKSAPLQRGKHCYM